MREERSPIDNYLLLHTLSSEEVDLDEDDTHLRLAALGLAVDLVVADRYLMCVPGTSEPLSVFEVADQMLDWITGE
jgi:hypothetical protein